MVRKIKYDHERVHVILRAGDMERLKVLFPRTSPSAVIRSVVSAIIDQAQERKPEADAQFIQFIDDTLGESTDDSESTEPGRPVLRTPGHSL